MISDASSQCGDIAGAIVFSQREDFEAANAFIRDVYLPAHNARFAVPAAQSDSAFTPIPGVNLDEILCVQEERRRADLSGVSRFPERSFLVVEADASRPVKDGAAPQN